MEKLFEALGTSPAACELAQSVARVAPTEAGVLIVGESGAGKEVVARAIHDQSARKNEPFVVVNCGAISPSLVESELFGHEKGSFTGASATTKGCFERAHPGTLFLDEITEMPLAMQVQLLRVLETGQYHRVGGSEQMKVNLRIIAATNRNPKVLVQAGRFRPDLLYRLAVFPLRIPPLRERKPDISYLSQRFLNELNAQEKTSKAFSPSAQDMLESYHWPGNVRELKNTVTRAFILSEDLIDIEPFSPALRARSTEAQGYLNVAVGTSLTEAQKAFIMATLKHYAGDKRRTALALGISQKTLYNRLEQFRKSGDLTEAA